MNQIVQLLEHYRQELVFAVHAFAVMSSHVHLMITTGEKYSMSEIIHRYCLAYTHDFNLKYKRRGHFWIARFWRNVVESDAYALACLRYLHMNPVKAGLVSTPREWRWSSHRFYAEGIPHPQIILTPHTSYLGLAEANERRRVSYLSFFDREDDPEVERSLFEGRMRPTSRRGRDYLQHFLPASN